jgi:hypothetical protein
MYNRRTSILRPARWGRTMGATALALAGGVSKVERDEKNIL